MKLTRKERAWVNAIKRRNVRDRNKRVKTCSAVGIEISRHGYKLWESWQLCDLIDRLTKK